MKLSLRRSTVVAVLCTIACAVLLIWLFHPVMQAAEVLLTAAVITFLLYPMVNKLSLRMPRSGAVALCFTMILLIVTVFIMLAVPMIIRQGSELFKRFPEYMQSLNRFLEQFDTWIGNLQIFNSFSSRQWLADILSGYAEKWESFSFSGLFPGISRAMEYLLAPVIAFYFLRDGASIGNELDRLIPQQWRARWRRMRKSLALELRMYLRSQVLLSFIVGLLSTAGLLILRIPYALIFGLVIAVFNFIPYFGPFLGAIPVILLTLISFPERLIWVALMLILAQQIENALIGPVIMGEQIRLHPAVVIIVLLIGAKVYGITGVFAVPAALVARVLFSSWYQDAIRYHRYEE